MIVTIDGPAGAGKSSAARALAQRLGIAHLDTGAMFRAVALAALCRGLDPNRASPGLLALLETLELDMPPGRVVLNGEDVTGLIRTPDVSAASSQLAVVPAVRHRLAALQRHLAVGRDLVCEGRDQGTAVFPDALCKFFLIADPLERARRRHRERLARGEAVTLDDVLREQEERDRRDAGRELAPLRPAADAVILDSSHLTPEQILERLEQEVRRRWHKG